MEMPEKSVEAGIKKIPFEVQNGIEWAQKDLNLRPSDYESAALTN